MPLDRFLIAPFSSGLQRDLRPWLIMDDAMAELENAYVWRGRVRKRFGSTLMTQNSSGLGTAPLFSRLRIALEGGSGVGTTDGSGDATGTLPGTIPLTKVGQLFSIGTQIFTVDHLGTPAALNDTGASITASLNTTSGVYTFVGTDFINTQIYFYPALPVMGIDNFEVGAINNQPVYAFDTQFAYTYNGGWNRSGTGTTPEWHGTNLNFFWVSNYRGATPDITVMFITNFNATVPTPAATDDPIWYFDGTSWGNLTPIFSTAGDVAYTSRLIVSFKNRLLLLNVVEQNAMGTVNTSFVNRCRYSFNGSPFAANAWIQQNNINGGNKYAGGGFIDAATEEAIISAEFIKDRLIVYFERSTWELAYTGNSNIPFVWQKLNTELGSEAQQSTVPFDKEILTIGNTGVHACNGSNVQRIDNKIPDIVFQIIDKNIGVQRVSGIRDYFSEMVYWTFPSIEQNANEVYPAKVLVYNYRNGSWAINDDCFTSWGYFEQQQDITWQNIETTWEDNNNTWNSGIQDAQFRQVIGGNQQGFVLVIDSDESRNAPSMQITALVANMVPGFIDLTIIDHTLNVGDYIAIENCQGSTQLNGLIFKVYSFNTINEISIEFDGAFDPYTGGGTVARVSQISIQTKQWNPYDKKGMNVYLSKIDFGVDATSTGQIVVDYYPSSTELSMLEQGGPLGTDMIMGTGILETFPYPTIPLELQQNRLWHPVYFQTDGECIQLQIYLNDIQMRTPAIAWSDFQLEGMVLHTQPTSTRLQ